MFKTVRRIFSVLCVICACTLLLPDLQDLLRTSFSPFYGIPYMSPASQDFDRLSSSDALPAYEGEPFCEINGNLPYFTKEELLPLPFENYSELDELGRCGTAFACLGPETMPEEERSDISDIRPSGWKNRYYGTIDRGWLYNRCHLIGYQLSGENNNEKNLITGTRYFNIEGMKPFEDSVASYIRTTGHHVLYRVTPFFRGTDLVASGVMIEARSVEDPGLSFCVYCFNVQPGIVINYSTGANSAA